MKQLNPGEEVRVFGLVKKRKLNGRIGTIQSYDHGSDRFAVKLNLKNNQTKTYKIKTINLHKLWIGLDVKFSPNKQEDIPSMKEIMTAWGFVISEFAGYAEEFLEMHQWLYYHENGENEPSERSRPFDFHQQNCIPGMEGCSMDFGSYQDLDYTDADFPIEEKALLFRSEKQTSQYFIHLLESHSDLDDPVIDIIASMLFTKPKDEDIMNFVRCQECKGFVHRKEYWTHVEDMLACYSVVTDILFTETLEELAFKYKNWREEFERNLIVFGQYWTVLIIEEQKRLTTQEQHYDPRSFIFVQCPKDADMKKARIVDFRLLSDRAIGTLIFAEVIKKKSPYQLFKSEPQRTPLICEIRSASEILQNS